MNRSTAALLIAILLHLVILLLFMLLGMIAPKQPPKKIEQERRIKVALKERPEVNKNAALKNRRPEQEIAPPMPKGEQIEKIVDPSKTRPLPKPEEQIPVAPPKPIEPQQEIPTPKKIIKEKPVKPKVEPVPSEKPYIPFMKAPEPEKETEIAAPDTNVSRVPDEHRNLFAKLSKKQANIIQQRQRHDPSRRESRISEDLKEAYGDALGELSEGEQKYILDNQEIMRRLTQTQLNRTGSTDIPNNLRVNDYNLVEFYLHPNGDMTDFRFIRRSNFFLLDQVTQDTIEAVFWRYPRPEQKTLIRYKFGYYLRGY